IDGGSLPHEAFGRSEAVPRRKASEDKTPERGNPRSGVLRPRVALLVLDLEQVRDGAARRDKRSTDASRRGQRVPTGLRVRVVELRDAAVRNSGYKRHRVPAVMAIRKDQCRRIAVVSRNSQRHDNRRPPSRCRHFYMHRGVDVRVPWLLTEGETSARVGEVFHLERAPAIRKTADKLIS